MSLFQCGHCGCCENTALSGQGCDGYAETFFDWTGLEDRKGKKLCSACAPTKYADGTPTEYGQWHGRFDRVFLPAGMFKTAKNGNLAHVETGDEDFRKYELPNAKSQATAALSPVACTDGLCGNGSEVGAGDTAMKGKQ